MAFTRLLCDERRANKRPDGMYNEATAYITLYFLNQVYTATNVDTESELVTETEITTL